MVRQVRVLICAIQNNELKIESKHLIFKASIAGMKTRLFVDNSSKTKFIDEFFMRTHKLSIFKLEKCITLILKNNKRV